MSDFILELYSEEIPAKMQKNALENFDKIVNEVLKKSNLNFQQDDLKTFISANRLVISLKNIQDFQLQQSQRKIGPKIDSDTKSIEGFAKSMGLSSASDLKIHDGFYVFEKPQSKTPTEEIIKLALPTILLKMQNIWTKTMVYNVANDLKFKWIRPIRAILALYNDKIIDFSFAHLKSSNKTFGKNLQIIEIKNASTYQEVMQENHIIIDQFCRKEIISNQIAKILKEKQITINVNFFQSNFFEELVGLADNPTVLVGKIDNIFLELPHQALNITLQHNQKYICTNDYDGNFSPYFLFICNCEVGEHNQEKIIRDNEKIMRARLNDLKFFIEEDLKKPLINFKENLVNVIQHQKIGNMADKILRFKEMAKFLSVFIPHCDINLIDRAVDLSKADLCTKAVAEMPELQGYFGSFYAKKQLENHKIIEAIYEHYLPIGANSEVAKNALGVALSISDKIDNIVGFFLVKEIPTSSRDPYALRRCALGIIRTSHQHNIAFPIRILVERSLKTFPPKMLKNYLSPNKKDFFILKKNLIEEIVKFIIERLKIYLKEQENIRSDILQMVLNDYIDNLDKHKMVDVLYLIKKIKFLNEFINNENNKNLINLYKRSANILAIEENKDKKIYQGRPSILGFKSKYERLLYRRIKQVSRPFYKLVSKAEFEKALALLAIIETPLTHFFDHIVVNDIDNNTRENRLILLAQIREIFNDIGNLSKIEL